MALALGLRLAIETLSATRVLTIYGVTLFKSLFMGIDSIISFMFLLGCSFISFLAIILRPVSMLLLLLSIALLMLCQLLLLLLGLTDELFLLGMTTIVLSVTSNDWLLLLLLVGSWMVLVLLF